MKTVCVYHKNCTDGTTSAAVVLLKYPDAILFNFDHNYKEEDVNNLLSEIDEETTVYIVDFALKPEDLQKLLSKAKQVINIDHHISVKDYLEKYSKQYKNFKFVFDNSSSGASLTYKYLFDENVPMLIKYVEDKDIWKWEFGEETKYINDYLFLFTNKPENKGNSPKLSNRRDIK